MPIVNMDGLYEHSWACVTVNACHFAEQYWVNCKKEAQDCFFPHEKVQLRCRQRASVIIAFNRRKIVAFQKYSTIFKPHQRCIRKVQMFSTQHSNIEEFVLEVPFLNVSAALETNTCHGGHSKYLRIIGCTRIAAHASTFYSLPQEGVRQNTLLERSAVIGMTPLGSQKQEQNV